MFLQNCNPLNGLVAHDKKVSEIMNVCENVSIYRFAMEIEIPYQFLLPEFPERFDKKARVKIGRHKSR